MERSGLIMKYYTVISVLDLKSVYQIRCMETGDVYYVRAKYFAGMYKKMDVIKC